MAKKADDMKKVIRDSRYPTTRKELLNLAYEENADTQTKRILHRIPDKLYESARDVSEHVAEVA